MVQLFGGPAPRRADRPHARRGRTDLAANALGPGRHGSIRARAEGPDRGALTCRSPPTTVEPGARPGRDPRLASSCSGRLPAGPRPVRDDSGPLEPVGSSCSTRARSRSSSACIGDRLSTAPCAGMARPRSRRSLANAWYLALVVRLVGQPGQPGAGDYGPDFLAAAIALWLTDAWFGAVALRLGGRDAMGGLALAVGSPSDLRDRPSA